MADVAKLAGVSRQLVSLVMRNTGYVSPEKKKKVLAAAKHLGYKRNRLAASLAGKQTNSIGMMVLDIHNQVFADFAEGASEVFSPSGYQLLLTMAEPGPKGEFASLESLVELRVDGILVATHLAMTQPMVHLLKDIPTVTMGEDSAHERLNTVKADNEYGAKLATEHLISLGHTKIAFLSGSASKQNANRSHGYNKTMLDNNLTPLHVQGDSSESGGEDAFKQLWATGNHPTAIFCYNDASAIGVMSAAKSLSLKIPEDIAIVGYDNTQAAGYPGVDLTSVDQRAKEIGKNAATLLLAKINGSSATNSNVMLTPNLVIRRSTDLKLI